MSHQNTNKPLKNRQKKGIQEFIIGAFILGSFSLQAGRPLRRPPKPPQKPPLKIYLQKMSDKDLIKKYGPEVVYKPLFKRALLAVWPNPGEAPELKTLEGKIIYDITRNQRIQIILSEEWSQNGARENAIRFLVLLINSIETLHLSKAFDEALLKLGLANESNLEKQKQKMRRHIEAGTLFQFFANDIIDE